MSRLAHWTLLALALSSGQVLAAPAAPGTQDSRPDKKQPLRSFSGRIAIVSRVASDDPAGAREIRVWLRTDAGNEIDVRLGPDYYVEGKRFRLAVGEKLVVRGWRIPEERHVAVMARRVRHEKEPRQTLELRDAEGKPLWGAPPAPAGPPAI